MPYPKIRITLVLPSNEIEMAMEGVDTFTLTRAELRELADVLGRAAHTFPPDKPKNDTVYR